MGYLRWAVPQSYLSLYACALAFVGTGCQGFQLRATDAGPPDVHDCGADSRPAIDQCSSSLATDPHNCGTCGNDCEGGECKAGVCQPVILASLCNLPQDVAVGGGFVYWVEQGTAANACLDGKVLRAPITGCKAGDSSCPKILAKDVSSPGGVALSAADLFWTEYCQGSDVQGTGRIWRMPLLTEVPAVFAAEQDRPRKLVVETGSTLEPSLYWITSGAVMRKALEGGTPNGVSVVGNQASPVEITMRGATLYWTNWGTNEYDGTVVSSHATGKDLKTIADGQYQPRGIAVNATYLYWCNAGNGTVMRAAPGSEPQAVVSGANAPNDVALDLDWLYWLEGGTDPGYKDGRVMAMRLDGTGKRPLATEQIYPRSIALDEGHVYWVNRGTSGMDRHDGTVMKIVKPR